MNEVSTIAPPMMASAQSEGEDRGRGERRCACEAAEGMAHIGAEIREPACAARIAMRFAQALHPAEGEHRPAARLRRGYAACDVFLGFQLDVMGDFVVERAIHAPGTEHRRQGVPQLAEHATSFRSFAGPM